MWRVLKGKERGLKATMCPTFCTGERPVTRPAQNPWCGCPARFLGTVPLALLGSLAEVAPHWTIHNRHALTTPDTSSEKRGIAWVAPLLSKEGVVVVRNQPGQHNRHLEWMVD